MDFSIVDQAPYNILIKIAFLLVMTGFIISRIAHGMKDFARTQGDWKSIIDEGIQIILGLLVGVVLIVLPASFLLELGYNLVKFGWNLILVPLLEIVKIPLKPLP